MTSNDTTIAAVMEQLIEEGPQAVAQVMTTLMNLAMRLERERFLGAGHYQRGPERRGYANGTKPKTVDTLAGTLALDVPKTAGAPEPFYPQSLERGRRSCRAVMLAAAEMYVKGVSTRAVESVLAEFGIEGLSSTQVSRAAKLLDADLESWRKRPLGHFRYVFLDARYEKTREHGVADDCAVLTAIGAVRLAGAACSASRLPSRRPRYTGAHSSKACSRADCTASSSLPRTITPAARPPARPYCPAPAGSAASSTWPRMPSTTAPNHAVRKAIGEELRAVWNAPGLKAAEAELKRLVASYRTTAAKLAQWLESNVPDGLAVFKLPKAHWLRMRTTNPIERSIQQELKRRTQKIRVFANEASLERLVSAILIEIDEQWAASQQPYVNFNNSDAD